MLLMGSCTRGHRVSDKKHLIHGSHSCSAEQSPKSFNLTLYNDCTHVRDCIVPLYTQAKQEKRVYGFMPVICATEEVCRGRRTSL